MSAEKVDVIVIDYSGWIAVDKKDLKVVKIDELGNMPDVDTTEMTVDEVVNGLKSGDLILKSFGDSYSIDAIEGGDETFDFSIHID